MESAEIPKPEDDKTIRILKDKNSVLITIDKNGKEATISISDGGNHKLRVEEEKGMLNVYNDTSHDLLNMFERDLLSHFVASLQKNYNYNMDKYRKRMRLYVVTLVVFIVSVAAFILLLIRTIVWG